MPEESTPSESPVQESAPALPVGVTVNKRAVMVEGQLVEMEDKDQIKTGHKQPAQSPESN